MNVFIFLLSLAISFIAHYFFCCQIIYSLFYSLPLSIYYSIKRETKIAIILKQFIYLIAYPLIYIGAMVIVFAISSNAYWIIFFSNGVSWGRDLAIISILVSFFNKSTRNDLHEEFFNKQYYGLLSVVYRQKCIYLGEKLGVASDEDLMDFYNQFQSRIVKLGFMEKCVLMGEIQSRADKENEAEKERQLT